MSDMRRIPFTEQFERVQKELVRDNSAAEAKYKGRINDVYTIDLPSQIDWRHLKTTTYVTTIDDYSTGHILIASSTSLTGDSTVWTSANSNNLLIKVSGYDEIYRCTYVGGTSLTIDRTWIGTAISSNTDYVLFQDRYVLASTFDRMALDPDKTVYYYQSGNKVYLKYRDPDVFEAKQTVTPNTPAYYTVKWINGDPYIFIDPPDNDDRSLYYVHIPTLKRMDEYTTGTITILANGGTAVTGSGTDFDGFVTDTTNYDYYFRVDADGTGSGSKWYKISTAASGTSLTLSDAYAGTAISAGTSAYTISMVSLLPAGLDLAMIYGAAVVSAIDQGAKNQVAGWSALYDKILSQYRAVEGKLDYSKQRVHTIYERTGVRR
jgi:hypothetical protein